MAERVGLAKRVLNRRGLTGGGPSLRRLVRAEEGAVDAVLEPEGQPAVPGERPPGEKAGAVAEVQDQQEAELRSEAPQRPALQGGQEVVTKDRRLADGVDADLGQLPPWQGHAIPAAEDPGVGHRAQEGID